ncbi:polysaccharide pyruvyl transferase family protein [Streptococcus porcinus]
MKAIVINQYTENRGDEAAGTALVKNLLKNPKIEQIHIIYNSAYKLDIDDPRVFHRNEDLRLKNAGRRGILKYLLFRKTPFDKFAMNNKVMNDMVQTIKEADYIYVTPCGASLGIYKDWAFLIRLLFVIKEKKTPIFCLNTIGASGNKLFDFLATKVLKKSNLYVREQRSKDYLESLGLKSELGVDTAFSLDPIKSERDFGKIGLVVTLLDWHPEFKGRNMSEEVLMNIIPAISEFCQEHDYSIDLIPHIAEEPETTYINQVITKLIESGLPSSKIIYRRDIKTSDQYDEAISKLRFMVGMRYHSIVLASKNAIPFLALAYENKMREVCRYTNCLDNYLNLQDKLTTSEVKNSLENVDLNIESIHNKLELVYQSDLQRLSKLPLKGIEQ